MTVVVRLIGVEASTNWRTGIVVVVKIVDVELNWITLFTRLDLATGRSPVSKLLGQQVGGNVWVQIVSEKYESFKSKKGLTAMKGGSVQVDTPVNAVFREVIVDVAGVVVDLVVLVIVEVGGVVVEIAAPTGVDVSTTVVVRMDGRTQPCDSDE